MNRPAVYGDENPATILILFKGHIIPQPALDSPALIIIAAGTLLGKLIAMTKAVDIKGPQIGANAFKVFDQFMISHIMNRYEMMLSIISSFLSSIGVLYQSDERGTSDL